MICLVGHENSTFRTLNVLADQFPLAVRMSIFSEQRYAALLQELQRLDADVLCLQEVSHTALEPLELRPKTSKVTSKHACITYVYMHFSCYLPPNPVTQSSEGLSEAPALERLRARDLCDLGASHREAAGERQHLSLRQPGAHPVGTASGALPMA